jgi:hypothetical protein
MLRCKTRLRPSPLGVNSTVLATVSIGPVAPQHSRSEQTHCYSGSVPASEIAAGRRTAKVWPESTVALNIKIRCANTFRIVASSRALPCGPELCVLLRAVSWHSLSRLASARKGTIVSSSIDRQRSRLCSARRPTLPSQCPPSRGTGLFLRTLAASKPAGRFLELGTGTGVATAWLLDGMDHASRSCSMPICAAGHIAAALARRNIRS